MPKNLLIVESPAKAKTINKYLGTDYIVSSSYGHVRDLPKGNGAIDIENGFQPTYVVTDDKKDVVRDLKKLAKGAEIVWLATDDDREGEAISWHLKEALELDETRTRRIVFREITKKAVQAAISAPRQIDQNLVNAQQARRVLDRLVGFELSPVLWKKIKTGLSAGRVQSAAVRIIVERERDIEAFASDNFFKIAANFPLENGAILEAELPSRIKERKEAVAFLESCKNAEFSITDLVKKPGKKRPSPPFTTSTLQQEASRKIGYGVAQTMRLAQKLYEAGHITYMRTDSLNLSEDAIAQAGAVISQKYGARYSQARRFKTKSSGAQEAHEAIRPTDFSKEVAGSDAQEKRLYDLIRKRAMASQMADAELEKTTATIGISTSERTLQAQGEVITFEGFLKVYLAASEDDDEPQTQKGMLPPLTVGQILTLDFLRATERFTRAKPRYTEASLVKALEEMGIGRPSTYAPIISTIQKRNYVVKESRDGKPRNFEEITLKAKQIKEEVKTENTGVEKNKLFPTDMGMIVNDFLVKYFSDVVDLNFTASVEKQFDEVAEGKAVWNTILADFYKDFHPKVAETEENVDRKDVVKPRELGVHPKNGRTIVARMARYGPVVEMLAEEEDGKPQFASLRSGQFLHTVTLEEALDLFKLPRELGEFEDKVIKASLGRFGPYVVHDGLFASIPKEMNPYEITLEQGIALIKEKRISEAKKTLRVFDEDPDLKVRQGRWGPYILSTHNKRKKVNVRIPKDVEYESLSYDEMMEMVRVAAEKDEAKKGTKKKAPAKKKTTAKKTTAKKATTTKKATTAKKKTTTTRKASTTAKKKTTTTRKKKAE